MIKKCLLTILCLSCVCICSCSHQTDKTTTMTKGHAKTVNDCNKPECGCENSCGCSTVCACKCNS